MGMKRIITILLVIVILFSSVYFMNRKIHPKEEKDRPQRLAFPFSEDTILLREPNFSLIFGEGIEFHVPKGTPLLAPIDGKFNHVLIKNPHYPVQGEIYSLYTNESQYILDIYICGGVVKSALEGYYVQKGEQLGTVGRPHTEKSTLTNASVIITYKKNKGDYVNLSDSNNWDSIQW